MSKRQTSVIVGWTRFLLSLLPRRTWTRKTLRYPWILDAFLEDSCLTGKSPLHSAVCSDRLDAIRLLIELKADVNKRREQIYMVSLPLVTHNVWVSVSNVRKSVICTCCKYSVMLFLLCSFCWVDILCWGLKSCAQENTPVCYAQSGAAVRLLSELKADIHKNDFFVSCIRSSPFTRSRLLYRCWHTCTF